MEYVHFCLHETVDAIKKVKDVPERYYLEIAVINVSEKGRLDVLQYLLNDMISDADPKLIKSVFIGVCHNNHTDIIKYLFNEKIVNFKDKNKFLSKTFTIMCESSNVTTDTLHLLKTLGADINYKNFSPIRKCCQYENDNALNWLINQGAKISECNEVISYLANKQYLNMIRPVKKNGVFRKNIRPSKITPKF